MAHRNNRFVCPLNIWKKLRKSAHPQAEAFLRAREMYCVSAISRFTAGLTNNIWTMPKKAPGTFFGVLFYGKRLLFPVFAFPPAQAAEFLADGLPLPLFFPQILKSDPLHAAQGLAGDMDLLEAALKKKGLFPASSYDYELRSKKVLPEMTDTIENSVPLRGSFRDNLTIRKAEMADASALFPLQAGYEQEEVLPQGALFEPAVCLKGLEYLIAQNMLLVAELEGRPVGKANINAQSYNCLQIGGVYVRPEFRSLGIAQALTTALIQMFARQKNHFTLYVKKTNIAARRVYDKLGFVKTGDYRISYYG